MQVAATALGGRDFEGQVTKEINGKTYILIGNEQQLRAIGSGKKVIGRINKVTQTCTGQGLFGYHWVDGASSTEYAGDADLADSDTLRNADASDYDNSLAICHTKVDADKTRTRYYGVGADGTQANYSAANTGLTYSADANYLIFRDIDLSKNAADTASTEWTPLMFSGTMLGAVSNSADAVASLWKAVGADGASVEHTTAARPVISHVVVNQQGKQLDVSKQQGIGFFASITNKTVMNNTSLGSAGTAVVSNLKLQDVSVTNQASKSYIPPTLLGTLTSAVGGLLDLLLKALKGAADVFLETERKVSRMFSLEERSRAVELYLATPMTTAQVVECLGYPTRQCLERWLAMDPRYAGRMAKPIIPLETRRKAIELVLGGMQQKQAAKQLGVSVGAVHNWVRAYRRGGMAALQPRNQNAAQGGKSASVRPRGGADAGGGDDVEALRRRVEELELENALMREVVEVVKKDPGADLRRLSNREKTMLIDRLRPRYSLRSMACLLRIAPSSYHYHHARIGVDKYAGLRARVARAFADSKGRYGYRRVKAALGTGVSEKVIRRLMAEGGLSAHVPKRRRYSSYEGETTPAPGNLVNRDFTAERPNEKWLTDITEIKASDGKVYLSPMIDCHDGKIVAYTAGFHPNAELANRMLAEAAETLPDNARPVVHSD